MSLVQEKGERSDRININKINVFMVLLMYNNLSLFQLYIRPILGIHMPDSYLPIERPAGVLCESVCPSVSSM